MRYYDIQITGPNNGAALRYTSHPNGPSQPPDPGALQVEMDVYSVNASSADTGTANINSWLRVWGISIQDIGQARNLNQGTIQLSGGMGKGLPLANSSQSGVLVNARINQCYGNWLGTDMTLEFQLSAGGGPTTADSPRNLVMNWKANTPMSTAIKNTLATGFPGMKADINISSKLTLNHDEPGYYPTLAQYAEYVRKVSQAIVGTDNNYQGVQILVTPQNTLRVYDGTASSSSSTSGKIIAYTDLVGQPTWIAPQTIMVTCAMRADILVGDKVQLPQTQVGITQQAQSAYSGIRDSSIFQGTFEAKKVRHVGNFKQPSSQAWVTHIECYGPTSAVPAGNVSIDKITINGQ